ncbi:MAG: pantoate--beta-alanine ligase [Chloroflexi bacterium]|nr:pantoate--beta-alanine ligase [Chloroflexota bacterium]
MRIETTIATTRRARLALPGPVGFVPTMGYLHAGHLSLVRAARRANASVVASLFVNPTQFGPSEDLATYPRDVPRDLSLFESEGVDLVFAPTVEEMYPAGFTTFVELEKLSSRLEGAHRSGHFRGVATVVAKLFSIVQPDRAYFGQKDAQQSIVVRRLTADLNLPVEVVVCPTVREPDGLALSSRNVYLKSDERQAATVLSRALFAARERFLAGERDAEALRQLVRDTIAAEPLVRLQYVSVTDGETLDELDAVERPGLLSLAAFVGRTRLIDNVRLED